MRDIRLAWSKDTSSDPEGWGPENPAYGQCAVTALVVQDKLGGVLLRAKVGDVSHYWNRTDHGDEIDLTREQFPDGTEIGPGAERSREYVLSFPDTERRYQRLRERVS